MKPLLLKVENISKSYPPNEVIWQNIAFDLARGEFMYILGGSGAGKSSLLRCLASLETPSGGKIQCLGVDLGAAKPAQVAEVRKKVSYIPQALGLIPDLSVQDHLEMARGSVMPQERTEESQIRPLIQMMGLTDKLDKSIQTLSGGERQRVAILRALSRKSDLLIADEPTGAQDFEMTWKLMDVFVKLNLSGVGVLLATHDLEMVRRLRKRCAILKEGVLKVEDRV